MIARGRVRRGLCATTMGLEILNLVVYCHFIRKYQTKCTYVNDPIVAPSSEAGGFRNS